MQDINGLWPTAKWTSDDWSKVRYLIKIKRDYRITFVMLIMFF